ncbi:hypothetical protein IMZ08_15345 [Bacillus luteolus]|uniref:Uncharacterized protein n=1 Tax=Litchfieldia luteola TaxID=682179 RepID=A0ABR9QLP5_9BACI|nr:hypothetical protein [Cytobacillus luteolus]MBE4909426.1 hypothetical protein [Cytobacillus luteolus]MBP1940826.1 hypothetical protein [Cytobacillus luteolus]
MASEYKLIPFNTYRECLAVTFKNVLSNNRWSIERALELYKVSDQTYKDYLRCKYTLLLLGPRSNEKIKQINEKQISNDKCESNNSDYYKDAKQRFVSLLTGNGGSEGKYSESKKEKSLQEDKNKVEPKMPKSKRTKKNLKNVKFSNSVLKHLQAYATDPVREKDKQDRKEKEVKISKEEIKTKSSQADLLRHELKLDLKKADKQKIKEEPRIDPMKKTKNKIVQEFQHVEKEKEHKLEEKCIENKVKVHEIDYKQETNQEIEYETKQEIEYGTKQELKQDIKISNKNGTAIIADSGNSTIYLDSY